MLDTNELRNLGVDELQEKLNRLKKELMQYRFQAKTGKLEQQSLLGQAKRDIARIRTIIREQELANKKQEVKA